MYGNNVINLIGSTSPNIDTFCANRYELLKKSTLYIGRYIIIEYSLMPDSEIIPIYKNEDYPQNFEVEFYIREFVDDKGLTKYCLKRRRENTDSF